MKKLPEVYVVPITKEINNNKEVFKSYEKQEVVEETLPIDKNDINKIFKEKDHVYKSKIMINDSKIVEAIGLTNNALLTLTGEKIPLEQIKSLKKV